MSPTTSPRPGRASTKPPRQPVLEQARSRPLLTGVVLLVVLAVVIAAIVILTGGSTGHAGTELSLPNASFSSTRDFPSSIDAADASSLQPAWSDTLTARSAYGSYSATPVVSGGVIYSQDLSSNVQAINLYSGKVIWTTTAKQPDQGPNGVVVAEGKVFGATPTAAFALNANTGKELWAVKLTTNSHEGIDMAPGFHDGIVYVSTVPSTLETNYGGGARGVLWALNAKTGARLWHFSTVPSNLWSTAHEKQNSGGGLWYTPTFDSHGDMYIGTGNPAPFPGTKGLPWGESRPGPNLYTDSIVKLNSRTGQLIWYYQLTPHDLHDWDLQDPPILATVHGSEAVIGAGKGGIVIALSAQTGKLLWKTPVGTHNGHDNDGLYAMRHEFSRLRLPTKVFPGLLGGVIAPMSSDGTRVFVPIVNHSDELFPGETGSEATPASGEVVALSVQTGRLIWRQRLSSPAFGATTVAGNLVFVTDFKGQLFAYAANNGHLVWKEQLPAGSNTGVSVYGDTLLVPAGLAIAQGQTPQLVAYRLAGGSGG